MMHGQQNVKSEDYVDHLGYHSEPRQLLKWPTVHCRLCQCTVHSAEWWWSRRASIIHGSHPEQGSLKLLWSTKGPSIKAEVHRDRKVSNPKVNQSNKHHT